MSCDLFLSQDVTWHSTSSELKTMLVDNVVMEPGRYMYICTIDVWLFKGTTTGYISHVPQ